jgi:hypothetical protein
LEVAKVAKVECGVCGKNCEGSKQFEKVGISIDVPDHFRQRIYYSSTKCSSMSFYEKKGKWVVGGIGKHCLLCLDDFPNHYQTCRHIIENHGLKSINYNRLIEKTRYYCQICGFFYSKQRFEQHVTCHFEKLHKIRVLETEDCICS